MLLNCLLGIDIYIQITHKISPKLGPKTVSFQLKTENETQTR